MSAPVLRHVLRADDPATDAPPAPAATASTWTPPAPLADEERQGLISQIHRIRAFLKLAPLTDEELARCEHNQAYLVARHASLLEFALKQGYTADDEPTVTRADEREVAVTPADVTAAKVALMRNPISPWHRASSEAAKEQLVATEAKHIAERRVFQEREEQNRRARYDSTPVDRAAAEGRASAWRDQWRTAGAESDRERTRLADRNRLEQRRKGGGYGR